MMHSHHAAIHSARAALFVFSICGADAAEDAVDRGRAYVSAHCSTCHAISTVGDSPNVDAPPFHQLYLKYPIEDLEESLGEGISTGHNDMPEFKLNPSQVGEVIAYLKSLNPVR